MLAFLLGLGIGWWSAPELVRYVTRGEAHRPVTAPPAGTSWVKVLTTAYCPCAICCGADADGRTAINRRVTSHPHGIAVEPRLIPYRTWLQVPGYGVAMVDDTGGAMRQSAKRGIVHLDLRFREHATARRWGRQWHWIAVPEHLPAARLAP